MRKIKEKKIVLVFFITMLLTNSVYGAEMKDISNTGNVGAFSSGNMQARGLEQKDIRGEFIAEGIIKLSNLKDGYVGIYAQTSTHVAVDKVRMRIYLDELDDKSMDWKNVNYYDFTYLKEDYENELLISPSEEFDVLVKKNKYYRIRGLHMVWKDGTTESFNTETDGLLITY